MKRKSFITSLFFVFVLTACTQTNEAVMTAHDADTSSINFACSTENHTEPSTINNDTTTAALSSSKSLYSEDKHEKPQHTVTTSSGSLQVLTSESAQSKRDSVTETSKAPVQSSSSTLTVEITKMDSDFCQAVMDGVNDLRLDKGAPVEAVG